jgi:nucleoside-diphosphate-sugar epimerase
MSTVVVTGAHGLVGSEAVAWFCERGHDVVGIDNDMRARFFGADASTACICGSKNISRAATTGGRVNPPRRSNRRGNWRRMPDRILITGLLAGPWQMGKVDQGVVALWMAAHFFERRLRYIGFGGQGKQLRDILHVDDLAELTAIQAGSNESSSRPDAQRGWWIGLQSVLAVNDGGMRRVDRETDRD